MKKIILILFLFLSCYLIYTLTENKTTNITLLGDNINDELFLKENGKKYNDIYTNKDYRIIDLINILKYNEEQTINNHKISIHRILNNTDILIISIGMNDLYYKLNKDTNNIYSYLNDLLNNMDILLKEINKYQYQKVFILGYYNINNDHNDLFTYINYKLSKLVKEYKYQYIELNNILKNNPKFYKNTGNFALNPLGYSEINKIIVEKIKKC